LWLMRRLAPDYRTIARLDRRPERVLRQIGEALPTARLHFEDAEIVQGGGLLEQSIVARLWFRLPIPAASLARAGRGHLLQNLAGEAFAAPLDLGGVRDQRGVFRLFGVGG
jgi:hypothetical protein